MTGQTAAARAGLTEAQAKVIARALYHVATLGGVHEREIAIIRDFLRDAGLADYEARLPDEPFDVDEARRILDTSFLRRLLLKAAILVVRADHEVSDEERDALRFLAGALGLADDLADLEKEVEGERLDG